MTEKIGVQSIAAVDVGLLVVRVGLGIIFIVFGFPKITGGPETWSGLGQAMGSLGITFAPTFWGFMAAVAEFAGGIALLTGLFVRPFAFLMAVTMAVATTMLVRGGAEMTKFAHPLNMAIVFTGLVIAGGGKLALGRLVTPLAGKWYR